MIFKSLIFNSSPLSAAATILLLLQACSSGSEIEKEAIVERVYLSGHWMFQPTSQPTSQPTKLYKAFVPGCVHTDLYKNGVIPDPFYGSNESDLQWIATKNWRYIKNFNVTKEKLESSNINLVFEGLDTYARILLNGRELGTTDNMFVKWEFNCKEFLKPGENQLEVVFESALNRFLSDSASYGYLVPGGRWVFTRKAAYHYGWDWGPRFITSGITAPLYLEFWNQIKPVDVHIFTQEIEDSAAVLTAVLEIKSTVVQPVVITIRNKSISEKSNSNVIYSGEQIITPETSKYEFSFMIKNPKLWWCNGLGDPHIYDLIVEVKNGNNNKNWIKTIPFGIRKIEVVNDIDSIGKSLYIKLNGVPVYMKGANYIPPHSFITEVTEKHYRDILNTAVKSNMNMLRVWGGGVYEKDIFYELCSRMGILVWQDFMFACAMYPPDKEFALSVEKEATYQIKRLRNYPALAMWCGNNESDEGWHNWQWQKSYKISPTDSAKLWEGYLNLFHNILPSAVNRHHAGTFYLPSSPMVGWGREQSMTHSSSHYWGVWWGLEPFERYLEKVPRFMSEFGVQAMPSLSTIRDFQPLEADTLFSNELRSHQKHPTGYQNILAYLAMDELFPKTLEEFIHHSQIIQAKGVGMAIEAQRRSKPYCMGTLYWQLNDCWPVTSWSSADVNNNWKALQYTVRNLYRDILVSVIVERDSCNIYLVSDRLTQTNGEINVNLVNFNLNHKNSERNSKTLFQKNLTLSANSSMKVLSIPLSSMGSLEDLRSMIIEANFKTSGGEIYTNSKFLTKLGLLSLKKADVKMEIKRAKGGYKIILNSNQFSPFVQLYLTKSHAWFEDNFVHLMPGQQVEILCKTNLNLESFKKQIKLYKMN